MVNVFHFLPLTPQNTNGKIGPSPSASDRTQPASYF
jgi:hypothetical protein